jgi:1-deoxy-D-xylulose-5-phosphate reductoisomerase
MYWPDRRALPVEQLDLAAIGQLTFYPPDLARYPVLGLVTRVMEARGLAGAIFNAAKERALDRFIAGDIGFCDMARVVEKTLDHLICGQAGAQGEVTLEAVFEADRAARDHVDTLVPKA